MGQHAMKCPICEVLLVEGDVEEDVALKRHIERVLRDRERQSLGGMRGIDDEEDEEDEVRGSGRVQQGRGGGAGDAVVKEERIQSVVPQTQIRILNNDDDDDDDDDDNDDEVEEEMDEDEDEEEVSVWRGRT